MKDLTALLFVASLMGSSFVAGSPRNTNLRQRTRSDRKRKLTTSPFGNFDDIDDELTISVLPGWSIYPHKKKSSKSLKKGGKKDKGAKKSKKIHLMDMQSPHDERNPPTAEPSYSQLITPSPSTAESWDDSIEAVSPEDYFPPYQKKNAKKDLNKSSKKSKHGSSKKSKKSSKKSKHSKGSLPKKSKKLKKSKELSKRKDKLEKQSPFSTKSPTSSPSLTITVAPTAEPSSVTSSPTSATFPPTEVSMPSSTDSPVMESAPTLTPSMTPTSALNAPTNSPTSLSERTSSPSSAQPQSFVPTATPTTASVLETDPPSSTVDRSLQPTDQPTSLATTTFAPSSSDAPSLLSSSASPTLADDTQRPSPSVAPSLSSDVSNSPTLASNTLGPSSAPSPGTETFQPSVSSSSVERTEAPTSTAQSNAPTSVPVAVQTDTPTTQISSSPSPAPSLELSNAPTIAISNAPSLETTEIQTSSPTAIPTLPPSTTATTSAPTTSAPTTSAPITSAPSTVSVDDGFTTTLDLAEVPANFQAVFIRAAAIWDSVIVGDLEDYPIFDEDRTNPELICDGDRLPEVVDDVFICASLPEIDGPRGILGSAGPIYGRFGDFVQTSVGYMQFDLADIELLAAQGRLDGLILHEMAHVYGTGTLWTLNGLVPDTPDCPYLYNSRASEEFRALSGCDTSVPIETGGGSGTACLHWDQDCFQSELMTGFNTGGQELSRISIATLEDMGYVVDYSRADPFSADQLNPSCVCSANSVEADESNGFSRTTNNKAGSIWHKDIRSLQASEQARQQAIEYGKTRLKKNSLTDTSRPGAYQMDGRIYLADKVVVVLYFDGDNVESVIVTPDS